MIDEIENKYQYGYFHNHQVLIVHGKKHMSVCGGTLISSRHILTTASRFYNIANDKKKLCDSPFLYSAHAISLNLERIGTIVCIHLHENYMNSTNHDIAILKLGVDCNAIRQAVIRGYSTYSNENCSLRYFIPTDSGNLTLHYVNIVICNATPCKRISKQSSNIICGEAEHTANKMSQIPLDVGSGLVCGRNIVGLTQNVHLNNVIAFTEVFKYIAWINETINEGNDVKCDISVYLVAVFVFIFHALLSKIISS